MIYIMCPKHAKGTKRDKRDNGEEEILPLVSA